MQGRQKARRLPRCTCQEIYIPQGVLPVLKIRWLPGLRDRVHACLVDADLCSDRTCRGSGRAAVAAAAKQTHLVLRTLNPKPFPSPARFPLETTPRNHTALSGYVSGTNRVPTAQLVLGFLPESREILRSGKTTRTLPSGMISKAERVYITEGIRQDVRGDGRSCSDYRPLKLELGVLPQASGSSRCQLGATDVLVGVKVRSDPTRGSSVYMSCTSRQHCSCGLAVPRVRQASRADRTLHLPGL